jgi:sulfoxide reductase heme-binding subunit YedZ
MKIGSPGFIRLAKVILWPLCLAPIALLVFSVFGFFGLQLGANPIEEILHGLGKWGLKFLLITLTITPLRRWTGLHWLTRFRRMLGLFAFFYILTHFLVYFVLDQSLDISAVIEDILKRPYITLGMSALVLMIPLAITSTKGMMRRLGKRWQKLHRLVYVIAVLGVWHFYWQVKLDTLEASVYAIVLVILLGYRFWFSRKKTA